MKEIKNETFSQERALYNSSFLRVISCRFEGKEDGESAIKESKNISVEDCYFDLRYPLRHDERVEISNSTFSSNARAAIWYSNYVVINNSTLEGIKAIRECKHINISNSTINSDEFGWNSSNIKIINTVFDGQYHFLMNQKVDAKFSKFLGKYAFQYLKNGDFEKCEFNSKDLFWHAENVIIRNSVINSEYLGRYSKNLTFIDCILIGEQPLCYAKNVKLVNCKMVNANLAFEYSSVDAKIDGDILSIKNPISGTIRANRIKDIIIDKDSILKSRVKIYLEGKKHK